MNRIAIIAITTLITGGALFGTARARQEKTLQPVLPSPLDSPKKPIIVVADTEDVLKGIDGVFIHINPPSKEARDLGLTRDGILKVAELSLRRNGIKVNPVEGYFLGKKPTTHSKLFVNVQVFEQAFSVTLSLDQYVTPELNRDTLIVGATVWNRSTLGIHGNQDDFIYKTVDSLASDFCLDYLKANPKK